MEMCEARLAVADTLAALNAALGRDAGPGLWFKESSARNLRSRDFLAPRGALRWFFPGGQVPGAAVEALRALPPVRSCQQDAAGLAVQLHRAAVFRRVLGSTDSYARPPPPSAAEAPRVVLHCAALQRRRRPAPLGLAQLRAVLVTDHLAAVLRARGVNVRLVPAAPEDGVCQLLHQLGVDWPWAPEAPSAPQAVAAWKRVLSQCPHAVAGEQGPGTLFAVRLRSFLEQQGLQGYDPSLDVLLVTEEELRALAELECAAQRSMAEALGGTCTVVHVVSAEEELQQQKADLLWRMLEPGALSAAQKHLVCGPVKATSASVPEGASQYYQLRQRQLHKASVMKYGDLAHDESWTEVIRVLTSAAIRFEMLSAAHRSQVRAARLPHAQEQQHGAPWPCAQGLCGGGDIAGPSPGHGGPGLPEAGVGPAGQKGGGRWGTRQPLPTDHTGPGRWWHLHQGHPEWGLCDVQLRPDGHTLPDVPAGRRARYLPSHAATARAGLLLPPGRGRVASALQPHPPLPRAPAASSSAPHLEQHDPHHGQHRGGVQVPGPAQHGLQLLLQPCPCPGGAAASLVPPDAGPATAAECGEGRAAQRLGHTPPATPQPGLTVKTLPMPARDWPVTTLRSRRLCRVPVSTLDRGGGGVCST